ncbi:MAG: thiolase domain-containing protein [Spirochaetaceae bacterium]|nr:thiolase domain-containing protein [Myxococcales bacterium]MCB9722790.1 thiolase domain-containing protein [Spirochaetaceae bacterium]HPG24345.1 thiolase domain-containing protein [Myxococcota bacterium]
MRDVAVVGFTQSPSMRSEPDRNEVEILIPVIDALRKQTGLTSADMDFICSGSSDYLAGSSFAFVSGLDAVGAWPPVCESHVEMDGAWALYEAWVKIQMGYADTALVYGFGKPSMGDLPITMALQLDPYSVMPLWPDTLSIAGLQARHCLEKGILTFEQMAAAAARDRGHAKGNPNAQVKGDFTVEGILAEPFLANPLRKSDCAPISDGASAIVLAAGDRARELSKRPAWIRGIEHICEPMDLGVRDLGRSRSTEMAAAKAGVGKGKIDVAELSAPFTHQEILVERALGLGPDTKVNPSGGALAGNPLMAVGLSRIGECATRIWSGEADRAVAHATSGPCLQQNLVCVLEGE